MTEKLPTNVLSVLAADPAKFKRMQELGKIINRDPNASANDKLEACFEAAEIGGWATLQSVINQFSNEAAGLSDPPKPKQEYQWINGAKVKVK